MIGCTNKTNSDKIFKLQKKAIRIITKSPHKAHTDPLFTQLRILKLPVVIKRSTLCFMHSIYHGYAPSTLRDHWTRGMDRELQYALRNNGDFVSPRCNYATLQTKPLFSFPDIWNSFNENKHIANKLTFKIALDHELLPTPTFPDTPYPPPHQIQ
jgi:hypothetical protein